MKERRKSLVLLLGLYMFLYMLVKHVVDIQTLLFQRKWKKFTTLSLVFESKGHIERNIWNQEQMSDLLTVCCSGRG